MTIFTSKFDELEGVFREFQLSTTCRVSCNAVTGVFTDELEILRTVNGSEWIALKFLLGMSENEKRVFSHNIQFVQPVWVKQNRFVDRLLVELGTPDIRGFDLFMPQISASSEEMLHMSNKMRKVPRSDAYK